MLRQDEAFATEFAEALRNVRAQITKCRQCFRTMEEDASGLCSICRDQKRDQGLIAVVEKESDLQNLEKTGMFQGVYHVLGGTISPLDSESPKKLHIRELYNRVQQLLANGRKAEVILATNPTTEGDTTAMYLERILSPLKEQHMDFKITRLGRGLSLGSELEYADDMTLRNALLNRK